MNPDCAIVVMAKQPQPGRTKTRLCPPFTAQSAANLYEALLKDTLALAAGVADARLAVAITPPESHPYFQSISPPGTLLLPISGADIGICLEQALSALLAQGFRRVVALNADGPSLPRQFLARAFHLLEDHDLVLGPGEDGGYYLAGLKAMHPALFNGIPWSTAQVLSQTLACAAQLELRTALTPPWYDIDTPQDVERLRRELDELPREHLAYTRRFFSQPEGAAG